LPVLALPFPVFGFVVRAVGLLLFEFVLSGAAWQ
jgi:hypothetical protein